MDPPPIESGAGSLRGDDRGALTQFIGFPHYGDEYKVMGAARGKDEPLTQHHKDIARSVQAMVEEAFFHLLNTLHARHKLYAVCVAGGLRDEFGGEWQDFAEDAVQAGVCAGGGGGCGWGDWRGLFGLVWVEFTPSPACGRGQG